MSMSWDDVVQRLKAQGFRYYSASTGPIEIDWWSGPAGGKNGHWLFISRDTIRRDPKYGDYGFNAMRDEYSFC